MGFCQHSLQAIVEESCSSGYRPEPGAGNTDTSYPQGAHSLLGDGQEEKMADVDGAPTMCQEPAVASLISGCPYEVCGITSTLQKGN